MTDDLGTGKHNYFSLELEETLETDDGWYVQKYSDPTTESESYVVGVRENRFGGIDWIGSYGQERDADQIMVGAEEGSIDELLEPETDRGEL